MSHLEEICPFKVINEALKAPDPRESCVLCAGPPEAFNTIHYDRLAVCILTVVILTAHYLKAGDNIPAASSLNNILKGLIQATFFLIILYMCLLQRKKQSLEKTGHITAYYAACAGKCSTK